MQPNPGSCPPEARGKRVRVKLRNGAMGKGTWAADTANWKLSKYPFSIVEYEVTND